VACQVSARHNLVNSSIHFDKNRFCGFSGGVGGGRLAEKMTSMVNNLPEWPNKCQSLAQAHRRANF